MIVGLFGNGWKITVAPSLQHLEHDLYYTHGRTMHSKFNQPKEVRHSHPSSLLRQKAPVEGAFSQRWPLGISQLFPSSWWNAIASNVRRRASEDLGDLTLSEALRAMKHCPWTGMFNLQKFQRLLGLNISGWWSFSNAYNIQEKTKAKGLYSRFRISLSFALPTIPRHIQNHQH